MSSSIRNLAARATPWLLLSAWLMASEARAQPARFALELAAPADAACIPGAELEQAVEERLGAPAFTRGEATHRVVIQLTRAPETDGWSAALSVRDARGATLGERQLSVAGPHCRVLDQALVLVVSTLIGLTEPADPAPPSPAEPLVPDEESPVAEPSSAPPAAAEPAAPSEPAPPPRPARQRFRLAASGAGLVASGSVPGPSFGAALSLHAQRNAFLLLAGAMTLPRAVEELGGGASGRFAAWLVRLQLCGLPVRVGVVQLAVCPGVRGGFLSAETVGLAQQFRRITPLVEVELGLRFEVAVTRGVRLFMGAGAALPLTTPSFTITEEGERARVYHQVNPGVLGELGIILGRRS